MFFKNINTNKIKKMASISLVLTTLMTTPALAKEYKIKKGDTLSKISKQEYGKSSYYDEIAYYNNITNPNLIKAGQVIKIPNLQDLLNYVYDEVYFVKKGDTLSKLCKEKYNSSKYYQALALYNNIDNPNLIYVGQIIAFPNINKINELYYNHQTSIYHTIKNGETLEYLSKMYYKTPLFSSLLGEYNCLDSNDLKANQQIFIPSYESILEFYNACKGATNVR